VGGSSCLYVDVFVCVLVVYCLDVFDVFFVRVSQQLSLRNLLSVVSRIYAVRLFVILIVRECTSRNVYVVIKPWKSKSSKFARS